MIGPQCHVGADAVIGAHTRLAAQVVFGEGCLHRRTRHPAWRRGHRCRRLRLRAAPRASWEKIEQLGAVRIGDDVEIGANSCVDRGALRGHGGWSRASSSTTWCTSPTTCVVGAPHRDGRAASASPAARKHRGKHCTLRRAGAIVVGHVQIWPIDVHIGAACAVTSLDHSSRVSYGGMFPFDENGVLGQERGHAAAALHALRGTGACFGEARSHEHRYPSDPCQRLPHRYPMLLVDRVLEVDEVGQAPARRSRT